ncbi:MAG TPA: glycosyltransferase family 1 protein, partial [Anaerolineae bacterium]|nr:glycosyltransferase family 1 protein [Anaerolineae bacterium]
ESARYYGQIDQAVRRADHIIAVSECTKQDAARLLGVNETKITVIYEAADPFFRPVPSEEAKTWLRTRYSLPERFILFVSTIEPRKNVQGLLRAYHLLREDYRVEAPLVLVGARGWLYDEVFATVEELTLSQHCRFLGRVRRNDLLYLYNAASCLVQPSFYEGFGLTLLEAMACGTPVITSNVSSMPEVVGDAGLLVDPNDTAGLAVAMWRVLSDADLHSQLREKGLKRAASFSWKRAARETLTLYRHVAHGASA